MVLVAAQPLVFAIAGSALLLPYYLGILSVLQTPHEPGATPYIQAGGATQIAGLSGGALLGLTACAGIPGKTLLNYVNQSIVTSGETFWAKRPDILQGLAQFATVKRYHKKCSKSIHVAISALDWQAKTLNGSKTWVVDKFRSETDYWGALVGSSTLTCAGYDPAKPANGGPTYVTYRNTPSMDGAYANDLRVLCKALGQEYGKRKSTCVTIESYVPGVFRKDGIKKGEKPKSATATTATTAESSTGELATGSRRSLLGKQARNSKLPKDCGLFPNGVGLPDTLPPFPLNGPWPDIFPGCDPENPIAFTFAEWQDMAMDATKALPNFQLMYNYGAKDAELWIKNQTGTRKL